MVSFSKNLNFINRNKDHKILGDHKWVLCNQSWIPQGAHYELTIIFLSFEIYNVNYIIPLYQFIYFLLSGAAEGIANEQDGSLAHLAKTEVCSTTLELSRVHTTHYIQCGLSMASWSIYTLFCYGQSIPFFVMVNPYPFYCINPILHDLWKKEKNAHL